MTRCRYCERDTVPLHAHTPNPTNWHRGAGPCDWAIVVIGSAIMFALVLYGILA